MTQEEETRHLILTQFVALAAQQGYRNVRMAEIAQASGMSRQNLYRYFSSREELYRAAMDELFDHFWLLAEPHIEEFDDRLALHVNYLAITVASSHPEILRILADPELHDLNLSLMRRYFARVIGALVRHKGINSINRDYVDVMVAMVAGASLAALRQWVEGGMRVPVEDMARLSSHILNGRALELLTETH